jgi:N-acyl-D-aspartate/D-glutamate deacylase
VLDLPTAIAKMTSMPARKIGLEKRGEISEGSYADLVIFDPDKIRDVATFDDPHKYPEGIELVMVNGKVAVENGEFHGVLNGKVLKKGMGH